MTPLAVQNRAATDLGILPLGQILAPQHVTRMAQAYGEVYAQLKTEGLTSWPSEGDVPDPVVPHLAALIAENCLNTYGVSPERYQRLVNAAAIARPNIRLHVNAPFVSTDEPEDF